MCTVLRMHATFAVHSCFNMKPLNRTQPTNFQLCSNQSTSQPQFLVWRERAPQNTFAPSPHICRSIPDCKKIFNDVDVPKISLFE